MKKYRILRENGIYYMQVKGFFMWHVFGKFYKNQSDAIIAIEEQMQYSKPKIVWTSETKGN